MATIREAQAKLNSLGYSVGPSGADGIAGRNTQAAVRKYQKDKGLPVTGVLDTVTMSSLFGQTNVPIPWMEELLRRKGLHEVRNKSTLWAWLKSDGRSLGDPSKLPWCGDAVETAIALTLPDEPIPANPYWAQNWKNFGTPVSPRYGAILVFVRPGGGHVGFYMNETKTHYVVAGGNQSNSITTNALIAKDRLIASRWPKTFPIVGPKRVAVKGGNVSTNEA